MEEGCPARASLSFCPPLDRTGQGGGGGGAGENSRRPEPQTAFFIYQNLKSEPSPHTVSWVWFKLANKSCELMPAGGSGRPAWYRKMWRMFFYSLHLPSLRNTSSLSLYSTTLGETVYSPDLALYWKSGFSIIILELGLTVPNLV